MVARDIGSNAVVHGGLLETTYLVYVDDSGDETQDLLTALAIPVTEWTNALQAWRKYRRWITKRFSIGPDVELHALDLGSNNRSGDTPLAKLRPGDRTKITEAGFSTLRSITTWRALTLHAPVAAGSGQLYGPLVEFLDEFCDYHDSHAVVWYDGTAESLGHITRGVHRKLPYTRRVLEDPRGYASDESHLIQMVDHIAYAAHHAILNHRGIGPADTYLRREAYTSLLPTESDPGWIWPGGHDDDDFASFTQPLGIRGYP